MKRGSETERGLVLINALLVVAALSAVAVILLQTAQSARNRQFYIQEVAQTRAYLDGFELLLRRQLDADRARGDVDHLNEPWAQKGYTVPIDRGMAQGRIHDLQGRFNLNWLAGGDAVLGADAFVVLIRELGLNSSLAEAIMAWVSETGPKNLTPYLAARPGIKPPGGQITLLDELRLVSGVTPAIFAKLQSVLTAVPTQSAININTAPRPVLQAAMPGVSASVIGALIALRKQEPFADSDAVDAYLQGIMSKEERDKFPAGIFVTSSRWFQAEISVRLGQTRLARRLVFRRAGENAKTRVEYRFIPKEQAG